MLSFSVIIPVFNKEGTLPTTLRSVTQQHYPHFEVIVVDDGSTDGSVSAARSVRDDRIQIHVKPNGGPGSARNFGVVKARYEWIVFLDADDLLLPETLFLFEQTIRKHPEAEMIVGNFLLDEGGKKRIYHHNTLPSVVGNNFKAWFYRELMPCAGTYACRKTRLERHPYNESLRRSEDTELLFNLFRETCIVRIDDPVMCYRRDYSSESLKKGRLCQDFQGHLVFGMEKSLWEKICLYELYIEALNNYPSEAEQAYPEMKRRILLKIAYLVAFWHRAWTRKRKGT